MEAALSTATATHGAALRLTFSENILTEASKSPAGARIYAISINLCIAKRVTENGVNSNSETVKTGGKSACS